MTQQDATRKLDVLAQVLIGTFAAVAGVLALVGANSDRVWTWLDEDERQWWLVAAGLLGLLAVGLCLVALLLANRPAMEAALLGLSSMLYVSAILVALLGAAQAADTAGRPTFAHAGLAGRPDAERTLSFTVRAENVDSDQRIRVEVSAGKDYGERIFSTVLRPGALGVVEHSAELSVPPGIASSLRVLAVRADDRLQRCPDPDAPEAMSSTTGPACLYLSVPPG
jgi:hypothetical protein